MNYVRLISCRYVSLLTSYNFAVVGEGVVMCGSIIVTVERSVFILGGG